MLVGGDLTECIEAGGVNGTKFNAGGMSLGRGCSSGLIGVAVTDAGIIDGNPFETVGCAKVEVCCAGCCCCSTGTDGCCFLEYS
jgi:hypothetical protein